MGAERPPLLVDDVTGLRDKTVTPQERAVVVAREEARLLALGAPCDRKARMLRFASGRFLVLLAERKPDFVEMLRVQPREHVRLILLRVGAAMQKQPAAVLADARVVAGREPVASRAACEREQLRKAKGAVAADAWVRRLAACVTAHERSHDRAAKLVAEIEGHVRQPEPMARLARRDHGLRRTAGALRVGTSRVEPEPKRDTDRVRRGA